MRVSSACCSHHLHLELSLYRLMVSVLDSGSMGLGSSPGRGHCVVFLGKTLYSHSALFTQVYKWVPANVLEVTLRWTSIPSRGE